MRRLNLVVLVALFSALLLPLTTPTPAEAVLTGVCNGQADISGDDGTSFGKITPKTNSGVYTVPIKGAAAYTGQLDGVSEPDEGRAHNGFITVALPSLVRALGISDPTIKTWNEEDSTSVADAGSITWDLPGVIPRGVEMTVSGSHNDPLGSCTGSISVKLDGGLLDSAAGVATAVGTVLLGALTLLTGIPTKP
jgi:hypothetical protein